MWKCRPSVKQLGSGCDAVLGVSSGSMLFAYKTMVAFGRIRVQVDTQWVTTRAPDEMHKIKFNWLY